MAETVPVRHLVDGALNHQGFGDFLKEHRLEDREYDYSVLAVFGGQSTGKSTLLNKLFNTGFQEMQGQDGRAQTTQGVWMSKAAGTNRLVLLDFEGADSVERGDDQSFEKKLGLFALAMADVLLINLFQFEIGRRQAMSIPLLENILQINFKIQLQLAESSSLTRGSKKLLMFVVRDYDGITKQEKLAEQLLAAMESIWSRISKPEANKDDELQKWFDFRVKCLPHFMMPTWEEALTDLRDEFIDENNPNFAFKSGKDEWRSSGVIVSELDTYSQRCWDAIKSDKDINIPAEKELVARHRAGETVKVLMEDVTQQVDAVKQKLKDGQLIRGLRKQFDEDLAKAVASFKTETVQFSRYQDILSAEEAKLREGFESAASQAMDIFYTNVMRPLEQTAKELLSAATKKLSGSQDWNTEVVWSFLRKTVVKIKEERILPGLDGLVKDGLIDPAEKLVCCAKLEEKLTAALRFTMSDRVANVVDLMGDRFLFRLLHNAQGMEEAVKPEELESERCPLAYAEACKVLEALLVWRLDEQVQPLRIVVPDYPSRDETDKVHVDGVPPSPDNVLIPQDKVQELHKNFCAKLESKMLEAKLNLKERSFLPSWVYIIFFILGLDEMMWMCSNPLILLLVLAALYIFARNWIRQAYYEGIKNGNPTVKAILLMVAPYVEPLLLDAPAENKSAHDKKND